MYLEKDASTTIMLGPFLDSTDGVTAETSLTIANTDVKLSKDGGDFANATNGATTKTNGFYSLVLAAGDTDTIGELVISVDVVAGQAATPVWGRYTVVPAKVYTSLVGGTDNLEVDAIQVSGTTQTAGDLQALITTADTAIDGLVTTVGAAGAGLTAVDVAKVGGTTQTAGDLAALITTADTAIDGLVTTVGTAGDGLTGIPEVDANVTKINSTAVVGTGISSDKWRA